MKTSLKFAFLWAQVVWKWNLCLKSWITPWWLKKFVTYLSSLKKSKSWQRLKTMIHDPILPAKLKNFEMVSEKLNAFLRRFQTDKPMVSFTATILGDVVHDLLSWIILRESGVKDVWYALPAASNWCNWKKKPQTFDICCSVKTWPSKSEFYWPKSSYIQERGRGGFSRSVGTSPWEVSFEFYHCAHCCLNSIQIAIQSKRNACIKNFQSYCKN